jgi:hypothetical protein
MKKIGEGISIVDIQEASDDDLMRLLDEIVHRNNVFNTNEDDTVLYQLVWIEIVGRLEKAKAKPETETDQSGNKLAIEKAKEDGSRGMWKANRP